jgi:hypothetical protein
VFDHAHYVPVLLAKRGERRGVGELTAAAKTAMTPLWVLPPVDWDFDTDAPAKTADAHLATAGRDIAQCWGGQPAFVDPYFLDQAARMASGQHPLDFVIEQANGHGGQLVPTVAVTRDAGYRSAVAVIAARDGRGACVRLAVPEWPSNAGAPALDGLLADVALTPGDVDLVLDLGEEVAGAAIISTSAVRAELAVLPQLADWRSITVVGAGFPKMLDGLAKGLSLLERSEWTAYKNVVSLGGLPRLPAFGDYGIAHPDPTVDVDPRVMSISATFRYTTDDAWLLAKGALFKGRGGSGIGGAAMTPVAAALAADPRFAGAAHCAGDTWIEDTAAGRTSGGNPESWRRAGTTHHLTHVPGELAILHGS